MGPNGAALARITTARPAPAVGAGLLGLAAAGQASARAVQIAVGGSVVSYAAMLCVLALAGTVPLAVLRPVPATVMITAASAALLALDALAVAVAAAQLIAVYRLGSVRQAGSGGGTSGQLLAVGLAVPFLVLALTSRDSAAPVLLASLVPVAAGTGIAVRARRAARTQTATLDEIADTLTQHTARGERARIARELHDVVAHHMAMIAVQAETARMTTAGLPAAGAQRFTEIGDTARAGLTGMRRLLGVLREDADVTVADRHPQPGLPQLTELIDSARAACAARLIVSGPVAEFDPGVELAAYRIVQEALTNARRHAPGAAVDVELRYDDDALHLRIRDNGPGPGQSTATGGHGLLGMRERAATVGGTLRTGAAPGGGFCVEADLPAKPEVT